MALYFKHCSFPDPERWGVLGLPSTQGPPSIGKRYTEDGAVLLALTVSAGGPLAGCIFAVCTIDSVAAAVHRGHEPRGGRGGPGAMELVPADPEAVAREAADLPRRRRRRAGPPGHDRAGPVVPAASGLGGGARAMVPGGGASRRSTSTGRRRRRGLGSAPERHQFTWPTNTRREAALARARGVYLARCPTFGAECATSADRPG